MRFGKMVIIVEIEYYFVFLVMDRVFDFYDIIICDR